MKNAALFLICALSVSALADQGACPTVLPATVEAKLLPVLKARDEASRKNDWWDKGYESAFGALLSAKDDDSKQARVALMDYYVGEAFGEELVCAVALDGSDVNSFLELYSLCDIKPVHSSVPRNHALPLRGYALKILKEGHVKDSCTYN
jgi:hypothetical protein